MCILCTHCHFAWPNSWPFCIKKGHLILSSIQGKIFFSLFARASLLQWHFERFWKATARVFHMSNWWKQLIPQRQSVPGVYKGLFGTGPVQFQMVPYGHFPGKLNTIPRPKLSDFYTQAKSFKAAHTLTASVYGSIPTTRIDRLNIYLFKLQISFSCNNIWYSWQDISDICRS